ncbi:MAG TPA: beta-propeller fold lactonase family protein [Rhizomicrobium sp.]|jgi:6-phosphogluconolactonase (cycloisomerase 2 family)|nr:beta-propeller fold lactonase family protein [Rhizomicrobium sp.]
MLNRRNFTLGASLATVLSTPAEAQAAVPFYASIGPRLNLYGLDAGSAILTLQGGVTLPANVQYAWPHPSGKFLYVAASNGQPGSGPMGATGADRNHYAIAFKVGADGSLTEHGPRRLLTVRPLHISADHSGSFLFIAYNIPSHITVHRLMADGTIGEEVMQAGKPDFGIYAHQIRATPGNKTLTLCSRGNDATATKPEDPGHIEVFGFKDGQLSNLQSIAPHGNGLGFGPRHLDFHPNGRFVYVSLERENSLAVFGLNPDGTLLREPLFYKSALTDPDGKAKHPGQGVGPIHVHPSGRFVYQTNRGSGVSEENGRKVSNGGENDIVVWTIDQKTGEPDLIQRADAHGFELRTFTMDPSSRVLIAASTTPMLLANGDKVSAGLSLYRVGADGKLDFARKIDVDTGAGVQFWCGCLNMP